MELYDSAEKKFKHIDKKGRITDAKPVKSDQKFLLEKKVAEKVRKELVEKKAKQVGPYVGVTVTQKKMHVALNTNWKPLESKDPQYKNPSANKTDVEAAGKKVLMEYKEEAEKISKKPDNDLKDEERAIFWLSKVPLNSVRVYGPFSELRTTEKNMHVHGEMLIKDELEKQDAYEVKEYQDKIDKKLQERLKLTDWDETKKEHALNNWKKVIRHGGTMRPCLNCYTEHQEESESNPSIAKEQGFKYKMEDSHDRSYSSWRDTYGGKGKYNITKENEEKIEQAVGKKRATIDTYFKKQPEKRGVHERSMSSVASEPPAKNQRTQSPERGEASGSRT
ncbi:hypothetical protein COO91_08212 [Nostoc flagelliforme CCNUN1]|uniref:Uncharacterized protein n=1 Tax=Nostoc flagelliforme CCNUN1 TaxID=2038116 RepID=A0A2K8T330_9NOSO|nr:hypothetical protein [Nostoc flagelliforme]AUB42107.1 hypothetical protein COO91_08212 [Nostoc flagelliforme CCNUN1]